MIRRTAPEAGRQFLQALFRLGTFLRVDELGDVGLSEQLFLDVPQHLAQCLVDEDEATPRVAHKDARQKTSEHLSEFRVNRCLVQQ